MADDAAVMDVGLDTGAEVDTGADTQDVSGQTQDTQQDTDIDGRKYTREYRDWLKSIKTDPTLGKHAKTAYNDHGRVLALQELEPRGIDGVREKYALVETLSGRYEGGIDEVTSRLDEMEGMDNAILNGDPKLWEMLGEDFKPGLLKLGSSYLDFMAKANPQVYADTLQPHLFGSLVQAPVTQEIVRIEQILANQSAKPEEKLAAIEQAIEKMGQWYQEQKAKAGEAKQPPKPDEWKTKYEDKVKTDEQTASERIWKEEITPPVAKFESDRINALARPYGLRVDADGLARFRSDVKAELAKLGKADKEYMRQMSLYQRSRNPNPQSVQNFVKGGINKHVKTAVETVMNQSPWKLLRAKPGNQNGNGQRPPARSGSPVQAGPRTVAPVIVSAKPDPNSVDWPAFKRQSSTQQYAFVYPLKNGKVVQWKH